MKKDERTKTAAEAPAALEDQEALTAAEAIPHLADGELAKPLPLSGKTVADAADPILDCAATLFLNRGIAEAKMTDIAQAAGIGVATLYRRSSKTQLAIDAATLLWQRFAALVDALVASPAYLRRNGLDRLQALYREYASFYMAQPRFVAFIDELDRMIITEHVEAGALEAYNQAVASFYSVFEDAYTQGLEDGSIKRKVNFGVFYRATAHAMMGVATKIVRGDVLPTDDFSHGAAELDCIADMALWRLAAPNSSSPAGANGAPATASNSSEKE